MTSNTAGIGCKCGSSNCIASSGYYCVESSNSCSSRPSTTCVNTNGIKSNTAETDCKCGSSDCTSSSGYYCTKSTSTCALVESCATTHVANSNKAATNSITGTLTN